MAVATPAVLDRMYQAACREREADPRVEIEERKAEDFGVLVLHSFYVRYRVPLWLEVQCFEWTQGADAHSLPRS